MNIAKKSISETTITFAWADGSPDTIIDTTEFNAEVQEHARMHGFSQKLGDSYSGAKSVTEAMERFTATLDGLTEGDWNRKGVSTGGLWVAAIAQVTGETVEDVLVKWQAMDEETRKNVCKHPDVVVARKEIELARAKAKADDAPTLTI
jgi:hypothetical protein